jgi:broad specificity phosphatase PhoE
MAVHVLCVRHGLSTWNVARRWQGQADPPLAPQGRAGAAELAAALAETLGPGVRLWSSDLQRARDTAAVLAARLGTGPATVDPRLREADIGPWQGLTSVEIEAGWPDHLATGRRPPGFETDETLLARVLPALADVAAAADGAVPVVVTHAGVIRAVRRHTGAADEHLANLSGLWFSVAPDGVGFGGLFEALPGGSAGRSEAL